MWYPTIYVLKGAGVRDFLASVLFSWIYSIIRAQISSRKRFSFRFREVIRIFRRIQIRAEDTAEIQILFDDSKTDGEIR
jgi:hypothetical protein